MGVYVGRGANRRFRSVSWLRRRDVGGVLGHGWSRVSEEGHGHRVSELSPQSQRFGWTWLTRGRGKWVEVAVFDVKAAVEGEGS